ncbi:hypothetical protein [Peribacillus asahii]|uniref:hypothetical protein n=1 Tax=Peribacillus asahii TaxID=228899 RepID=UPI00207A2D13|nr:hypothetical protein [Peribacillus asahii]USK84928.1 hypothetical protein LIT35_21540 [Peribacillus asahii]
MSKKKAIKIATASAIALTGAVAVAQPQADAATNSVDKAITKATTQVNKAFNLYYNTAKKSNKLPSGSAIRKEVKLAEQYYAAAQKEIAAKGGSKKASYTKKLEASKTSLNRAKNYVAAVSVTLKASRTALDSAIESGTQSKVLAAQTALDKKIAEFEKAVAKVFGPDTRRLLTKTYTTPAKAESASVATEMKVYTAYKEIESKKLITTDLEKAGEKIESVKADVEKLKAKDSKLAKNILKAVEKNNAKYEGAQGFKVLKVSAINATQVEVKFNKAVDAETVFADGKSGAFKTGATVTLTSLDAKVSGALTGELSKDGKTLTITAANELSKRYDLVIDGIKEVNGKALVKYEETIKIEADTKAPTIAGTEQISANLVKIKFSEPVQAHTTATLKYADGKAVSNASVSVAEGATGVVVDLSDAAVEVNKPITVTFIGLKDKAGNLVTPNPATVEITKQQADGVKPAVESLTQTGVKTFNVKFSKDLAAAPTVTVSNYEVEKVEKVSGNEYKVTVKTNLNGVQNVTVASYKDLSNQAGESVTKVVTFTEDTAAPKAKSATVVVGSDNAEYLEVTYDKDVTEGKLAISGSYVKDHVTTAVATVNADAKYASKDSKKVLRVALSTFAAEKGAAYKVDVVPATTGGVASLSGVAPEKASASFTRGEDGAQSNTNKLAAPALAVVDNNTLTVTFTGAVDGVSATNAANYKVDGAVVESATLAAVADGKQVVTLKLKANSNTFTGVRNITVENVKALGSTVTMDKFVQNDLSLKENVAPTVTSAKLTANNTITLTYSEAVVTTGAKEDFEVLYGGKSLATKVERNATATISIPAVTAEQLAQGLSLKALETLDIEDAAGNKLSVPANITVAQ